MQRDSFGNVIDLIKFPSSIFRSGGATMSQAINTVVCDAPTNVYYNDILTKTELHSGRAVYKRAMRPIAAGIRHALGLVVTSAANLDRFKLMVEGNYTAPWVRLSRFGDHDLNNAYPVPMLPWERYCGWNGATQK